MTERDLFEASLKPCPWCGGAAEIVTDLEPPATPFYWISCAQACHMSVHCGTPSYEEAAALWNNRINELPIIIEVRGGIVQDVLNIPPGMKYEIRDYDAEENKP